MTTNKYIIEAHNRICRIKGKEYAPNVHELQAEIDKIIEAENYKKLNENIDKLLEPRPINDDEVFTWEPINQNNGNE